MDKCLLDVGPNTSTSCGFISQKTDEGRQGHNFTSPRGPAKYMGKKAKMTMGIGKGMPHLNAFKFRFIGDIILFNKKYTSFDFRLT